MNNKFNYLRGMMMGLCLFVPAVMIAAPDATAVLTTTHQELNRMAELIVNVISIIMGLAGVVMLGVNLFKYLKGDPSSNDALIKVGGGLLIAVVLLQIIRMTLLK